MVFHKVNNCLIWGPRAHKPFWITFVPHLYLIGELCTAQAVFTFILIPITHICTFISIILFGQTFKNTLYTFKLVMATSWTLAWRNVCVSLHAPLLKTRRDWPLNRPKVKALSWKARPISSAEKNPAYWIQNNSFWRKWISF